MYTSKNFATLLAVGLGILASTGMANAQANANVVISQVYGGGGNTGASHQNDFVELYNRTNTSINISNWAIQYTTSGGTSWNVLTIPATTTLTSGQYYLIQLFSSGANGLTLPAPDLTGTINMSTSSGKVALTSNNTALSGQVASGTGGAIIDFVGYGLANGFENITGLGAAAPTASVTLSDTRLMGGLFDSGVNSDDFTTIAPNHRNSSSFQPVPEPTTILGLSALGMGVVGIVRRTRRKV